MTRERFRRRGRRRLTLSNLDKVLHPATGFGKAEVIDFAGGSRQ